MNTLNRMNKFERLKNLFQHNKIIIFLIVVCLVVVCLASYFSAPDHDNLNIIGQQYVYLANSFLHGHLDFIDVHNLPSLHDTALYQNNYYWPGGPLPAIILIPLVFIFGLGFKLSFLAFWLIPVLFFVIYKLNLKLGIHQKNHALWLAFFFIFGTIFFSQTLLVNSYNISKILIVVFLFTALLELLGKQRFYLVGSLVALAGMTRFNTNAALIFFILYVCFNQNYVTKTKLINLFKLCSPVALAIIILFFYNLLRFDNFLETGYGLQLVDYSFFKYMCGIGLFSLKHLPGNIFFFLFKGPDLLVVKDTMLLHFPYMISNLWGLSIIYTSPLFLYLLFHLNFKERLVKYALAAILLIGLPIFTYCGIGFAQYGYAYALDFYPFLYLVLVLSLKNLQLTRHTKFVILIGFLFNVYLMWVRSHGGSYFDIF